MLAVSTLAAEDSGGQRSWFCTMHPVRKRLRLSPSTSQTAVPSSTRSLKPPPSSPQHPSHDALLLPPPPTPAGSGAEEEEEGYLLVEEDTTDSSLVITMEDSQVEVKAARKRAVRKRRGKLTGEEEEQRGGASESVEEEEEASVELEIDRQLDQSLETKSKQHNLTTVNVRNIIHEVITNEHVVAMMKAAINETEAVPPFEPKMTRSKFKEVVEKGVVIPAWNISPIKKTSDVNKAPQFVDIPLAEEDSSDEEYRPDEEDEDETAEDTFQESDMESTASSPRGSRLVRADEDSCSPWQTSRSRSRVLRPVSVSMGPPPPPKAPPPKAVTDSTFLEKLHAVEEELAVCMEPYQPLSESDDEVGLMAYRTRSKRPLRDVPLGRLEAELRAPDITPDMYDSSSTHEDREWTDWLRGLMTSEMDQEEKEVNELMEELFETLKEDLAGQEVDDEGHEEEEEPQEETHTVQADVPPEQENTELGDDEVVDGPITELRTVKQQLVLLRKKQQTHTLCNTHTMFAEPYTLKLDGQQKARLRQQLQQHVQLLTQVHLLTSPVTKLQSEAETTRQFLFELDVLAQRSELLMSSARPGFCSIFRSSNLLGSLQLLEELRNAPITYQPQLHPPDARGYMRCYPVMPAELAWLFATRPTLVQVRRRILQCCRPGFPDNVVKVFRYQRVLWPMLLACHPVDAAEHRPPVEREESLMPLWLSRSLPVIHSIIKQHNNPLGSAPKAPPPTRCVRSRQTHVTSVRPACDTYSFPLGHDIPHASLKISNLGALALSSCSSPSPLRLLTPPPYLKDRWTAPPPAVLLLLTNLTAPKLSAPTNPPPQTPPEELSSEGSEEEEEEEEEDGDDDDEERREMEDVMFAQDYLHRVCEAVQVSPGLSEQLLQLLEQQMFERSRQFLWQLGRRLGESSSLYQQISSLLIHHPNLQESFQKLHVHSSPTATCSENTKVEPVSQNRDKNRRRVVHHVSGESETGSDRKEEKRPADRAILTACQQRGANRKTFRQVSVHLGNKTAQQVSLRFHDLMNLFQSASQKSTSSSSEGRPISRQEAAPD
ncbi:hypothetical protein INR49_007150 [Caranx melampygus]|nr:hypothetical protein INR49_007150 [Caranx melampygus]